MTSISEAPGCATTIDARFGADDALAVVGCFLVPHSPTKRKRRVDPTQQRSNALERGESNLRIRRLHDELLAVVHEFFQCRSSTSIILILIQHSGTTRVNPCRTAAFERSDGRRSALAQRRPVCREERSVRPRATPTVDSWFEETTDRAVHRRSCRSSIKSSVVVVGSEPQRLVHELGELRDAIGVWR